MVDVFVAVVPGELTGVTWTVNVLDVVKVDGVVLTVGIAVVVVVVVKEEVAVTLVVVVVEGAPADDVAFAMGFPL